MQQLLQEARGLHVWPRLSAAAATANPGLVCYKAFALIGESVPQEP